MSQSIEAIPGEGQVWPLQHLQSSAQGTGGSEPQALPGEVALDSKSTPRKRG